MENLVYNLMNGKGDRVIKEKIKLLKELLFKRGNDGILGSGSRETFF